MARCVFYIDRLTTSIEDVVTKERWDTEVLRMGKGEWRSVLKKDRWLFNWKKELSGADREVYKLVIKGESFIQGLISLQRENRYIEMPLSFELGFGGYVAFIPKTRLVQHYQETLGARLIYRNRMEIGGESAKKLVNLYFKEFSMDDIRFCVGGQNRTKAQMEKDAELTAKYIKEEKRRLALEKEEEARKAK